MVKKERTTNGQKQVALYLMLVQEQSGLGWYSWLPEESLLKARPHLPWFSQAGILCHGSVFYLEAQWGGQSSNCQAGAQPLLCDARCSLSGPVFLLSVSAAAGQK